jgi:hypothetical protein
MNRISAGGNLFIDVQPQSWRLMTNGTAEGEQAVVEATPGEPLRYIPTFGSTRKLPDTGILPTRYVQQVVLGYSNDDEGWHLGFLLEPELAAPRGSRWCEVVSWFDPGNRLFGESARQAGQALAEVMERPFYFVPPKPIFEEDREPSAPLHAPLPSLPIKVEQWMVSNPEQGIIELSLDKSISRAFGLRALWYFVLSLVYLALSILTLTSGIALPRPEFLPYVGIASAVVLIGLTLWNLAQSSRAINRILVDSDERMIKGMHNQKERWRVPTYEIMSVYVSQRIGKTFRKNATRGIPYGELNLKLQGEKFQHILMQGQTEETHIPEEDWVFEDGVVPLGNGQARTSLQHVGLHIANLLNVPAYHDRRLG